MDYSYLSYSYRWWTLTNSCQHYFRPYPPSVITKISKTENSQIYKNSVTDRSNYSNQQCNKKTLNTCQFVQQHTLENNKKNTSPGSQVNVPNITVSATLGLTLIVSHT